MPKIKWVGVIQNTVDYQSGILPATSSNEIQRYLIPHLKFAHFPIRSEEQIRSKALVGWTNYLIMPNRNKNLATHWKECC